MLLHNCYHNHHHHNNHFGLYIYFTSYLLFISTRISFQHSLNHQQKKRFRYLSILSSVTREREIVLSDAVDIQM